MLEKLSDFDVSLIGDKICVKPSHRITDEIRQFVRLHKQEIISELQAANDRGKRKIFWWFYKLREDEDGFTRMPFLHNDESRIRKELESIYGHQIYDLHPQCRTFRYTQGINESKDAYYNRVIAESLK